MSSRLTIPLLLATLGLWAAGVQLAHPDEPRKPDDPRKGPSEAATSPQPAHRAVERALAFLEQDAVKWRKERGCATCHHGTLTVWAMNEAKSQGYAVSADFLADTLQWTKDQFLPRVRKPRDPRPGWNLVSLPALYLGVMSQSLPVLSRDELNQIASHLARHQEADGSWLLLPPSNGLPPPVFESRETLSLWAYLAWEAYMPADPKEAAAVRISRDKAADWLNKTKPTDTTQAAVLRLLLDVRSGKSAQQLQPRIDHLLGRQNTDGGWSQVKDVPSDAYATGQALWVLSYAGVGNDRPEVGKAVAFLVANQRENGSWPMTGRNHPEVKTSRTRNPVPITYFGSAWATLGLVRSVPPALDLAARQRRAFDHLRLIAGKYEVDDRSPGKPVVGVSVGYELDDEDMALLTARLTAFPQLMSLRLKSPRLTDAGLEHLKVLSQLRSLALENAAITDAGLAHLKDLTYLEELNLKGTRVTDAGIRELQTTLPKAKVDR